VIEAVTFDFWETLVSERNGGHAEDLGTMRDRHVQAWVEILRDAGTPVSEARVVEAFDRNWQVFHERWYANEPHATADATDLMCRFLDIAPTREVRDALLGVFAEVGRTAPLHLAPGIEGCLRSLRDAGLRLGIVCDVGITPSTVLRERLDAFGILGAFDAWSFSDETGCFKPFPEAFLHALGAAGVSDPRRAAHVGDGRRTDVAGARALGMTSVRYRYFHDAPEGSGPEADHVVDSHDRVPFVLGLG
jgi:putative hydrolase of the HAD superfamily